MRICSKCETFVIGKEAEKCPNCDEPFSTYNMEEHRKQVQERADRACANDTSHVKNMT